MQGTSELNPKKTPDRILRVRHVAEILESSPRTIRYWAETGILPAFKVGLREWRFSEAAILAYIEHRKNDQR
jgi:excisionase family DNA binding protein